MPSYPWLENSTIDGTRTKVKMTRMQTLGVPYTDEDIENAPAAVDGMTEMQVLIAYLQHLGSAVKNRRQ